MVDSRVSISLEPSESFVVAQFARYLASEQHTTHVSRQFLLDFAVVFLHHTNESGALVPEAPAECIPLSEEDILSLRELIPVTATVGSTPVGLSLHRKLCEALLRYHPEQASEVLFGDEEEPSKEAFTEELLRLKRRGRRRKR